MNGKTIVMSKVQLVSFSMEHTQRFRERKKQTELETSTKQERK